MSVAAPNRVAAAAGAAGNVREDELSFVQKLERIKATKLKDGQSRQGISRGDGDNTGSLAPLKGTLKKSQSLTKKGLLGSELESSLAEPSLSRSLKDTGSRFDPGPTPTLPDFSMSSSLEHPSTALDGSSGKRKHSKREIKAMKAMQKKNTDRLAAQTAMEGSVGIMGVPKEF
eukprot:gene25894-32426_t